MTKFTRFATASETKQFTKASKVSYNPAKDQSLTRLQKIQKMAEMKPAMAKVLNRPDVTKTLLKYMAPVVEVDPKWIGRETAKLLKVLPLIK